MKVAFPVENGQISQHFGHAPQFILVEMENGEEINRTSLTPPEHEPGVLPQWIGDLGVDLMVAGGMGKMAASLFKSRGVEIMTGISGSLDDNIKKLAEGTLKGDGSLCSHEHDHH